MKANLLVLSDLKRAIENAEKEKRLDEAERLRNLHMTVQEQIAPGSILLPKKKTNTPKKAQPINALNIESELLWFFGILIGGYLFLKFFL